MSAVSVLTLARLLRVALLVVTGVAHEFGAVTPIEVLADEHVQVIDLASLNIELRANLLDMIFLNISNCVLTELFRNSNRLNFFFFLLLDS